MRLLVDIRKLLNIMMGVLMEELVNGRKGRCLIRGSSTHG
jgi:hypothetical protein